MYHIRLTCLRLLFSVILGSLIDLFWGLLAQNWVICFPHALQSALFGFVIAAHLEEENRLIVSFLVSARGGGVYLCPGHDGSPADKLFFFVKGRLNLEEEKEQIPRNPKCLCF